MASLQKAGGPFYAEAGARQMTTRLVNAFFRSKPRCCARCGALKLVPAPTHSVLPSINATWLCQECGATYNEPPSLQKRLTVAVVGIVFVAVGTGTVVEGYRRAGVAGLLLVLLGVLCAVSGGVDIICGIRSAAQTVRRRRLTTHQANRDQSQ